ncbi:MAG: MBL fold metallo-hydrolase [Bacteroidetes bacterium]|nr:MBL fold metallo-hydrolase [Bacteroidota bacterium]
MKSYHFNPDLAFIKSDWKGNIKIYDKFVFEQTIEEIPFSAIAKYAILPNPQKKEKKEDKFVPTTISNIDFLTNEKDKIVWLGHSSFYIEINGKRIITDPVFGDISFFLKRKTTFPCSPSDFKDIDYILLSHGHRDHLDLPSLNLLSKNNPNAHILCPLKIGEIIKKHTPFRQTTEAGWWQKFSLTDIDISFLPAKHWNRRHLTDFNTTLWGSFLIQGKKTSIYFAGDSAKGDHFSAIKNVFQNIDYALMPIGAYKPSFLMEWAHLSPDEAIDAFHQLGAQHFIPMHYGTFDLSHEPASEPVKIIEKRKLNNSLKGNLIIPNIGEAVFIPHHN